MGRDWFGPRRRRGKAGGPPAPRPPADEGDYKREVIDHPRVRCPYCESYAVTRTGTDWPLRSYVCGAEACRKIFQTYDKGPKPMARRR